MGTGSRAPNPNPLFLIFLLGGGRCDFPSQIAAGSASDSNSNSNHGYSQPRVYSRLLDSLSPLLLEFGGRWGRMVGVQK